MTEDRVGSSTKTCALCILIFRPMPSMAMDVHSSGILHYFKLLETFIILILIIPLGTCLSFDNSSFSFPSFNHDSDRNLSFDGNATISSSAIQLTLSEANTNWQYSYGRATYSEPVHLWDETTGKLADFTTNFSFVIDSGPNNPYPADGLAFFLAPKGYSFPTPTEGSGLGLGNGNKTSDPNAAFVAVEFDNYYYYNSWDPPYKHIGIDIDSVNSSVYANWSWDKVETGGRVDVSISYSSVTQVLEILAQDASANGSFRNFTRLIDTVNLSEYLPEWVVVGFSAATGSNYQKHVIHSWEFTSSLQVPDKDEHRNLLVWIFIGIGIFVFITILLGSAWFFWRARQKKYKRNEEDDDDSMPPMEVDFEKVSGPRKLSYSELAMATDNFADQHLFGEGGFGKVFKGYLSNINSTVAIKKVTPESKQGMKEFTTEVLTISQLRHKNLVQLIGWCYEKKDLLLIYEFMTNGSLDSHLFKGKSCLTWEVRYKIAQGLASALSYLHDEWEQCVVHRDIKTSNILLDSSFNAKLGDFGLARLVDPAKGSQTTVLAGTMGYMAPEYVYTGKASRESDIYSFGVVLLEIACGRRVVVADGDVRLVYWVWELYGTGKLLDAADPKLEGNFEMKEIECMMIVGIWCAHPDYMLRPTIKEAISVLNFEISPPILPTKLPIPTYLIPSTNMSGLSLISSCVFMSANEGGNYTSESSTSTTNSKTISVSSSTSLLLEAQ